MELPEIHGPDLAGVIADATAAGLAHVVIGGFAVIAHGYPRSTKDSDLLVPDGEDSDAAIERFLELADARRYSDGKKLALDKATYDRRMGNLFEARAIRDLPLPSDLDGLPRRAPTLEDALRRTCP